MQSLRDILRGKLHTSLSALTPLDRLAAAWPVAAGHAIAERSTIVRLENHAEGAKAIAEVRDAAWLPELRSNTPRLTADLAQVSGVPLTDILFFAETTGASKPSGPRPKAR